MEGCGCGGLKIRDPSQPKGITKRTPIPESHYVYQLALRAKTLDSTAVMDSVKLPEGIQRSEWIAAQVLTIFDEIEHLASVLEDICNNQTCPVMCAGPSVQYSWADELNPKPRRVPAREYVITLMAYTYQTLSNPKVIPCDGSEFSPDFEKIMSRLLKRFFRVYAHTYLHHSDLVMKFGADKELKLNFRHYLAFVQEFDLIEEKELLPLASLIQAFGMAKSKDNDVPNSLPDGDGDQDGTAL